MKLAPVEKTIKVGALRLDIRHYGDGRFGFDYTPPGELRVKVRARTLEDAVSKGEAILGAAKGGRVDRLGIDEDLFAEFLRWKAERKEPAKISVLVPAFLKSRKDKGCTVATVRELKSTLEPFSEAFPDFIADVKRSDVETWLTSKDRSARRFNNMRAAICALYNYARKNGYLPAEPHPVEQIERRAVTLTVETYSPEELEALLNATPVKWRPLIILGAFCGLRPEEICPDPRNGGWKPGLKWEDVKWAKGKIDVPAAVSKVRRRRFAILTDAATAWLQPWRNASGPVVDRTDSRKDYHRLTGEWVKATGLKNFAWKSNALRHSYASYRLAITNDAAALALEMGNSPAMIFRHYLDLKHEDEAQKWFAIRPPLNVVSMTA